MFILKNLNIITIVLTNQFVSYIVSWRAFGLLGGFFLIRITLSYTWYVPIGRFYIHKIGYFLSIKEIVNVRRLQFMTPYLFYKNIGLAISPFI